MRGSSHPRWPKTVIVFVWSKAVGHAREWSARRTNVVVRGTDELLHGWLLQTICSVFASNGNRRTGIACEAWARALTH